MDAFVDHHSGEGEEVVGGRNEPARTGLERRRGGEARRGAALVEDDFLARREVGEIQRRQPVELVGRYAEPRVLHAERLENALTEEVPECAAGGPGDQHPEDVGAAVVEPLLSRLVGERQLAEGLHQVVRGERQQVRPRGDAGLG